MRLGGLRLNLHYIPSSTEFGLGRFRVGVPPLLPGCKSFIFNIVREVIPCK
jgi:hypothetical protein